MCVGVLNTQINAAREKESTPFTPFHLQAIVEGVQVEIDDEYDVGAGDDLAALASAFSVGTLTTAKDDDW